MKPETPIQVARKKAGKTQKQVATEIGIATNSYQQHEYGKTTPSVTTAIKVARALGVNDFKAFCELWKGSPSENTAGAD